MNILILEDDLIQQQKLEAIIKDVVTTKKIECKNIYSTAKPDNLIARIDNTSRHQLYFLDIEIKKEQTKGMDTAQLIRQKDKYGTIVFVTTHSEFAPITFSYKVEALDFIDKYLDIPEFKKKVTECIEIAYSRRESQISDDAFIFKNQQTSFQVPFSDILYFETSELPHKIRLITKNRTMTFYGDMKSIETMDDRLVRAHRSYIVNSANIISLNKKELLIEFENNESAMVSRRGLKQVITCLDKL